MQRIVVAQRSKEKGIVVNFVGTPMQRAALLFPVSDRARERNQGEYFSSLILRNVSTSFIFSKLNLF